MSSPTRSPARRLAAVATLLALLTGAGSVRAHGDGLVIDEFYLHVDRYADEIAALDEETDTLVARGGPFSEADQASIIDGWESVWVHEAIEFRATPLYPPVWQAIVGLRTAMAQGADASTLEARADAYHGALLQGLGGVKLAAAQVRDGTATGTGDGPGDTTPAEAVAAIRAALDEAVDHYDEGDIDGAESRIHDAYMQRFEGLEGELIVLDADLVSQLEEDFNANLPLLMQDGADLERVRAQVEAMNARLDRVESLLAESGDDETPEIF